MCGCMVRLWCVVRVVCVCGACVVRVVCVCVVRGQCVRYVWCACVVHVQCELCACVWCMHAYMPALCMPSEKGSHGGGGMYLKAPWWQSPPPCELSLAWNGAFVDCVVAIGWSLVQRAVRHCVVVRAVPIHSACDFRGCVGFSWEWLNCTWHL